MEPHASSPSSIELLLAACTSLKAYWLGTTACKAFPLTLLHCSAVLQPVTWFSTADWERCIVVCQVCHLSLLEESQPQWRVFHLALLWLPSRVILCFTLTCSSICVDVYGFWQLCFWAQYFSWLYFFIYFVGSICDLHLKILKHWCAHFKVSLHLLGMYYMCIWLLFDWYFWSLFVIKKTCVEFVASYLCVYYLTLYLFMWYLLLFITKSSAI